ncbi:PREDICTED: acylphosphatase-2-like [Rhagoletis zephyria]|uniref:acylphosphatase-2-like n=1 Tax=Rhagoletis zephyria TaxID=28612 RepID=UPI0008115320|nr:PREDICTED: acylphosphatase-2-like [Rhagoletis zephyria]
MDAVQRLLSVEYRVFGRVQGVFFRKYTKEKADQLGIFGWVKNERDGTVSGLMQGTEAKIDNMKHWLSHKGSPLSRIDKCEFTNEKVLDQLDLTSFIIKRG